ncbi:peptidyl-prolyl cis-trans isomerase [Steroidobacter sp. S1-65]|uniref:Peptidyl-prolyl cis-trans isomerase n=1 Tax=Steroidobacter gossypii TaxID=2805490 RepID=A0ABS1X1A9_9GAMM|nr:peptidylprolyl isomerase [Steroidobacter gossypii]MBM0106998.1 peptidyl-prolyl cis-trans isomerase [Steroidobacter gossypii]
MRISGLSRLLGLTAALLLGYASLADSQTAQRVRVETTLGNFVIELDPQRSPLTVAAFLEYVNAGHYTDTIFHRVIGNFVVQGGGFDTNNVEKPTRDGVPNESGNGLSNRRGTVGLARTGNPHSGTSQFYVNLADNAALDPQPSRWGYAVFGHVVEGMNVVDDIGAVATGSVGPFDSDAPLQPIVIKKVEVLK